MSGVVVALLTIVLSRYIYLYSEKRPEFTFRCNIKHIFEMNGKTFVFMEVCPIRYFEENLWSYQTIRIEEVEHTFKECGLVFDKSITEYFQSSFIQYNKRFYEIKVITNANSI